MLHVAKLICALPNDHTANLGPGTQCTESGGIGGAVNVSPAAHFYPGVPLPVKSGHTEDRHSVKTSIYLSSRISR